MDGSASRRSFLATATAVTTALAGCSTGGDGTPTTTSGTTSTSTETETASQTPSETDTETGTDGGGEIVPPAIDYGEVLTDFSGDNWYPKRGETLSRDEEAAISGTSALHVKNPGNNVSTVAFEPSVPFSLEGRNLSMAVKVDAPVGGRMEVRFRAPNGESRYVSTRQLPGGRSDWMRIDFGFTRGWNDPNVANIKELRVAMQGAEGTEVEYWIDDIRITETAGKPNAILAFYGGRDSHYETVLPKLEERGWAAAVPVRPSDIGAAGRMDMGQLREVRDAGWDVCSFPLRSKPLPKMSAERQREVITEDKEYLESKGFEDGAKHFFAPHNQIGGRTAEILRDVHETGFLYGGSSVGVPPTAPYTLPTIVGNDYKSSRDVILRANKHNQLVTLAFSEIGGDGMSVENFEKQLDRIENNAYAGGFNVITPSELDQKYL